MINKILLIAVLVFISEFCSCQTDSAAAAANHIKDSLAKVAFVKDSLAKVKDIKDSVEKAKKHIKDSIAKAKYIKDSTAKAHIKDNTARAKHIKDSTAKAKHIKDSTAKAHIKDSTARAKHIKDSTTRAKHIKDSTARAKHIKDSIAKRIRDSIRTAKKDSSAIIKDLKGKLKLAEETGSWLKIIAGILALGTFFLLFLFLKLVKVDKSRIAKIKIYEQQIEGLKNLLLTRNVLDPHRNYEAKEIFGKTEGLINKYLDSDVMPTPSKSVPEPVTMPDISGPANMSTTFVPYIASSPLSYIKTEIMLSAGPRKETANNDTELGEDIAGSISLPDHTYFWLLDGTSDMFKLSGSKSSEEDHLFSSRVLAQGIGYFIQKNIALYNVEKIPLSELLKAASSHVAGELEKNLNNDQSGRKESIIADIDRGHHLMCSTTVVIGCLFANGQFYALRAGDSKVFPFKKSAEGLTLDKDFGLALDPTSENDRIAFGLAFDKASNTIKINQHEELKWLSQSAENIECVFAFTDGIGPVTETQLASNKPGIVEKIRENISRIPQKKQDDKTLIILERITRDK